MMTKYLPSGHRIIALIAFVCDTTQNSASRQTIVACARNHTTPSYMLTNLRGNLHSFLIPILLILTHLQLMLRSRLILSL